MEQRDRFRRCTGPVIRWTKEACLEVIQRFEADCREANYLPSAATYRVWKARQDNAPSLQTLTSFNSWNAMRRFAGGSAIEPLLRGHGDVKGWSENRCLEAIRAYERACARNNQSATRCGYQEWQKGRDEMPSIGPIERFGAWKTMQSRAADFSEELQTFRRDWEIGECRGKLNAFVEISQAQGRKPLPYVYEQWRIDNEAPPLETVCQIFGSWEKALVNPVG